MNTSQLTESTIFIPAAPLSPLPDRDIRQRELVPPQKLAACQALVIGVGAIGRQVAIQLAAIGIPKLILIDHDEVGVENLATQAYFQEDLGRPKVQATAQLCRQLNPAIDAAIYPERFTRAAPNRMKELSQPGLSLASFFAVDSISTRRLIWETLRHRIGFFADGRMSAEVIRVLACEHPAIDDAYASTLFAAGEAHSGSCTARSTVYTATIAAGLMVHQFTRWLRGLAVDQDVCLNLLSMELDCIGSTPTSKVS